MHKHPESLDEVRENFNIVYRSIQSRNIHVKNEMLWKQEEIIAGNVRYFWMIVCGLMEYYEHPQLLRY